MAFGKIIRRVFKGSAAAIVLLLAVSLFLPDKIHVERQIIIEATPAAVFSQVNDYRKSLKWSPWLSQDPLAKVEFEGPKAGVGARMSWQSDHRDVGTGS